MNDITQFTKLGHIRANSYFSHFYNLYNSIGKSCLKPEWEIIQSILKSVILWLWDNYSLRKYTGNHIYKRLHTHTFVFLPVVTYSKYSWISITKIFFLSPISPIPLAFNLCWLLLPFTSFWITPHFCVPSCTFRLAWPTKDTEQFQELTEKPDKKSLTNSMIPIKELLQNCCFPHR